MSTRESIALHRFARGYLLTDDAAAPQLSSWSSASIGGLTLQYDPRNRLTTATAGNAHVAVLGLAIAGLHPDEVPEETVDRACRALARSEDAFFDEIDEWGGRHLIVFRRDEDTFALTDATAMRTAFYAPHHERLMVSSHAALVAAAAGSTRSGLMATLSSHPSWGTKRAKYLPGADTPWDGVTFLTANTMLRVRDRRPVRFWPRGPIRALDVPEAARAALDIMERQMLWLLNQKRPLVASLTAGLDSRTALAAMLPFKEQVSFFTYLRDGQANDQQDADAAMCIAEHFKLRFEVLKARKAPTSRYLSSLLDEINFIPHKKGVAEMYLGAFPPDAIHVRSNIAEIGRLFYASNDLPLDPRQMASRWRQMADEPTAVDAFARWAKAVDFDKVKEVRDLDLFYWEHRMSCWHGCVVLESDVAFDTVSLFNARSLLKALLGVGDPRKRKKADVFMRIMQLASPDLLGWPINDRELPSRPLAAPTPA